MTLHTRVNRQFNEALRTIPMSVQASGSLADDFCRQISSLPCPNPSLVSLSLGEHNNNLRGPALAHLKSAFSRALFPSLHSFHVEIHSELGEEGIFDLISSMLEGGLPSLTNLDFSGSYVGVQSTRRLAGILGVEPYKFDKLKSFNMSRNGTAEFGSK
jgi:hypothetical protein